MIAGRVQSMKESLSPVPGQRSMKLLPLAAVYGGNASGKSTFIKALQLFQRIVSSGVLYTESFRLCPTCPKKPSTYDISFVSEGEVWNYSLSLTSMNVHREKLVLIQGTRENVLFNRSESGCVLGDFMLNALFADDKNFLKEVAARIQKDVLFLRHALTFDIPEVNKLFRPTLTWFRDVLHILMPDSQFVGVTRDLGRYSAEYAHALANADTGIKELDREELSVEQLQVPESLIDSLKQQEGDTFFPLSDSLCLTKEGDEIHAYNFRTRHIDSEGNAVFFPLGLESDGTRRLIHLLPILIGDENLPRVYIIDEMDRSLHTALSKQIIEEQRNRAQRGVQQQLIFTTHDVMLMSQSLLRRDEMWAAEKDADQASHLISFEDFIDIRKDKDIRRSYLLGRMGGIPQLRSLT